MIPARCERWSDGPGRVNAASGQDTEAENTERHGDPDRHRREPAAVSHSGVQDRADEKTCADRLEQECIAVGDPLRIDERGAELVDRPAKSTNAAAVPPASWAMM